MKKSQGDLVNEFVDGATEGVCSWGQNLVIKGDKLIHYSTVIAERDNGKVLLNVTRYSLETGRVQKKVKLAVPEENLVIVKRVPVDYMGSLKRYVMK